MVLGDIRYSKAGIIKRQNKMGINNGKFFDAKATITYFSDVE